MTRRRAQGHAAGARANIPRRAEREGGHGDACASAGRHARAGGVLTEYPSLNAFDREDNLRVTVDFRKVYASLLESWMGTDAAEIVARAGAFGRLALVR